MNDDMPGVMCRAKSPHTQELAKLNAQYAEAYDAWHDACEARDRLIESAAAKEKEATTLQHTVNELKKQLQELMK